MASAQEASQQDTSGAPSTSGRQLLSIAPMMDWTDVHYRQMARLISRRTWLWTEMVVDKTITNTPLLDKFLWFPLEQHPIVFQLGGSDPDTLGAAAKKVAEYGYDEINLNCGCPSDRVAGAGCFGASLMMEPELVARCMAAIAQAAPGVPVTVKCRLGVDDVDSYEAMRRFVKVVSEGSPTRHFIIHARKCLLKGLNPHQNRTIPPLRYAWVYALKHEFPHLQFSLNGGIQGSYEARAYLDHTGPFALPRPAGAEDEGTQPGEQEEEVPGEVQLLDGSSGMPWQQQAQQQQGEHLHLGNGNGHVSNGNGAGGSSGGGGADSRWIEGVMIGRQAYNDPWNVLGDADRAVFGEPTNGALSRREMLSRYEQYSEAVQRCWSVLHTDGRVDPSVRTLMKPLLNLFHGEPGSKKWKTEVDLLLRSDPVSVADVLAKSLHLLPDHVLDDPPRQGPMADLAQLRSVVSMAEPPRIPILRFPRGEDRAGAKRSDVVVLPGQEPDATALAEATQQDGQQQQHTHTHAEGEEEEQQVEVSPDACCVRVPAEAPAADHHSGSSNGALHVNGNGVSHQGAAAGSSSDRAVEVLTVP